MTGTSLQRLFCDAMPRHRRQAVESLSGLDTILRELVRRAVQGAQGFAVSDEALVTHLARHLASFPDLADALTRVRTADLYLALAAAQGNSAAVAMLKKTFEPDLAKTLHQHRADVREEIIQDLWTRVLTVAPGQSEARIAGYAGVGPLGAWLAATATRLALNRVTASRDETSLDEAVLNDSDPSLEALDLQLARAQFRDRFREAFGAALAMLAPDERNLLRLHYLDGLSIDVLATMQAMHRSTVARRLARLRQALSEQTRTLLRTTFQISADTFESLAKFIDSKFEVSLNEALRN